MSESIILAGNFAVLLMLLFKSFSFGSRRLKYGREEHHGSASLPFYGEP